MAIPAKHLRELREMTRTHEMLAKMGKDKRVLAALKELSGDYDLRLRVVKNPYAFIRKKNIRLPRGAKVVMEESSPWRISVSVTVGKTTVTFGYDSGSGFFGNKKKKP